MRLLNLQSHQGRLKPEGLGVVGNNTDIGFLIHPTLALDVANGFPLGSRFGTGLPRPSSVRQRTISA